MFISFFTKKFLFNVCNNVVTKIFVPDRAKSVEMSLKSQNKTLKTNINVERDTR